MVFATQYYGGLGVVEGRPYREGDQVGMGLIHVRLGSKAGRDKWGSRVVLAVVLAVSGVLGTACSKGADEHVQAASTSSESGAAIAVPVRTGDGRMVQPEGHTGLWFETEPDDPLDHLVWVSQRYVGLTIKIEPLGDRAATPESAHLPDVCAPAVVNRMVEMEFTSSGRDVMPVFVQCSAFGNPENKIVRGIGFFWGVTGSVAAISHGGGVDGPDQWGYETIATGDLADAFGCASIKRAFSHSGAIFAQFGSFSKPGTCPDSKRLIQTIFNILGGQLVQV